MAEPLEARQLLSTCAGEIASLPTPRMAAILAQGVPAPTFTLTYYDLPIDYGLDTDPSQVIILNFFRIDAPLAVQTLPQIEEVYDWVQTQGRSATVLGVNVGEPQSTVQDYFANNSLFFPAVLDSGGLVASDYDVQEYPATYVICNGRIDYIHTGYSDSLAQLLEEEIQTAIETPLMSITGGSVKEGNSHDVSLDFTVSLAWASAKPIKVDYTTVDAAALAGSDYRANSGTLTFNPGETSKTISVNVIGDILQEKTEKFAVVLSNPTNAILAVGSAEGTILDDDSPVRPARISIDDYAGVEPAAGQSKTFNVTIRLAEPAETQVKVDWATADSTAMAGIDYVAASSTATIDIGQSSVTIPVTVRGIAADQAEKSFFINLSNAGADCLVDNQAIVSIVDDRHTISVGDASVVEGNAGTTDMTFMVRLSSAADYPISVDYYTQNYVAVAGMDFIGTTGTVIFGPGETEKPVVVKIIGDLVMEPDEAFFLKLRNYHGASIQDGTATGTILADGDVGAIMPTLSIGDVTVKESDGIATFTLTLSAPAVEMITCVYTTADGTALREQDYKATTGAMTIRPGEMTATLTIPLLDNDVNEMDEAFTVRLTDPVSCTLARAIGTATIVDDDPITASTGNAVVKEGSGQNASMRYTVALSRTSEQTLTLDYATLDGTAMVGVDYLAASGSLVFAPGEMSKDILIPVIGDYVAEADKSFTLKLTPSGPLRITTPQAIGTILDDDRAPKMRLMFGKRAIKARQKRPAVSFGLVSQGDRGPTRSFKVINTGTDVLRLGVVAVPAGFKLVRDVKHQLAPGQSSVFTVRMLTNIACPRAGRIRIATNAAGEKPYYFGVIGDVVGATARKK